MRLEFVLVVIFVMGGVFAASVNCVLVGDKVLVEVNECGECLSSEINLSHGDDPDGPPEGVSLFERDGDRVSFISEEFVRRDGDFIFALPVLLGEPYSLEVVLPSGFVLVGDFVYPRGYELDSDGRSIILRWENVSEEVIVFYEGQKSYDYLYWVLIFSFVILALGFWRVSKKRDGKRDLTRNLFGEEKRIVEFLIERESCWMKELVGGLGISKVMATRKVRSLVEKGILETERMGREMRIWLKIKD